MKTIWKYELKPGVNKIEMPSSTKILTVQTQFDEPVMWALVDTEYPKIVRQFYVTGTGHTIPDELSLSYIGTFQLTGGALVFHLFEIVR